MYLSTTCLLGVVFLVKTIAWRELFPFSLWVSLAALHSPTHTSFTLKKKKKMAVWCVAANIFLLCVSIYLLFTEICNLPCKQTINQANVTVWFEISDKRVLSLPGRPRRSGQQGSPHTCATGTVTSVGIAGGCCQVMAGTDCTNLSQEKFHLHIVGGKLLWWLWWSGLCFVLGWKCGTGWKFLLYEDLSFLFYISLCWLCLSVNHFW